MIVEQIALEHVLHPTEQLLRRMLYGGEGRKELRKNGRRERLQRRAV